MQNLPIRIPDAEVLLALTPEELSEQLLAMFNEQPDALCSPGAVVSQIWATHSFGNGAYPIHHRDDVEMAIAEAFAWMQAQGLLVRAPGPNGSNGFLTLSRRARKLRNARDFADYRSAQLLPRALLHPRIAENAWLSFVRGNFATAVFEAMREVEIAVREGARFAQGEHGASRLNVVQRRHSARERFQPHPVVGVETAAVLFARVVQDHRLKTPTSSTCEDHRN